MRTQHIGVRLSEADHALLRSQAAASGLTLSALVHARLLGASHMPPAAANENAPPDTPSRDVYKFALVRQLRGVGNNLNQIARHANRTGAFAHERFAHDLSELKTVLQLIDTQLDRLL